MQADTAVARKPRESAKPEVREAARPEARPALRPGEALDREGNIISRNTSSARDPFEIPQDIADQYAREGWTLQWCRISTGGQEDRNNITQMYQAGWRAVPSTRFDGRFMPKGHEGSIEQGGLILCERPKALTDAAIQERNDLARAQKNQQAAQFGMKALPSGFERRNANQDLANVSRSVEKVDPSLRPRLTLED